MFFFSRIKNGGFLFFFQWFVKVFFFKDNKRGFVKAFSKGFLENFFGDF